jgi:hypothetical protein
MSAIAKMPSAIYALVEPRINWSKNNNGNNNNQKYYKHFHLSSL